MFKYLVGLLALLLIASTSVSAQLSPQGCMSVAEEVASIAALRDAGTKESEMLHQLNQVISGKDKQSMTAKEFYTYWIKTVFSSKKSPQELGLQFAERCFAVGGDVTKLYGLEI